MPQEQYTISEAAREIGISRPTLYKYLDQPKYKPKVVAGFPVLSQSQIDAIKTERESKKNGTSAQSIA